MSDQLRLFHQPRITSRTIKAVVQDSLYGFELRMAARKQKREERNARLRKEAREEAGRLKARVAS